MTKAHHAGQKPTTIWMPEQLAAELDRKLADAAQPGLRPSRSGFIMHAVQRALQGEGTSPPAPVPTAPSSPPVAQAVEHAQLAQDELQVALRRLFQARKLLVGTDGQGELIYRDQDAADLAESAVMADVMYANLLDFARAGAAGLTEAPFCYIEEGWAGEDGEIGEVKDRSRVPAPLFRAIEDIASVFSPDGINAVLPGPLAAAQTAHKQAKAKAAEKAEKEAQREAKRAARAAKAESAKAKVEQLQSPAPAPSPPVPVSPFGPSEPTT